MFNMSDFYDFLVGAGYLFLLIITCVFIVTISVSVSKRKITTACELSGTFVVQGVVYNCEVKND